MLPNSPSVDLCPPGWVHFDRYCYLAEREDVINTQHFDACFAKGAYLASFGSEQENQFVGSYLTTFFGEDTAFEGARFCFGLNNIDGVKSWQDGKPYNYRNWRPGQPFIGFARERHCVGFHAVFSAWSSA